MYPRRVQPIADPSLEKMYDIVLAGVFAPLLLRGIGRVILPDRGQATRRADAPIGELLMPSFLLIRREYMPLARLFLLA
jgi:hypothetical protein